MTGKRTNILKVEVVWLACISTAILDARNNLANREAFSGPLTGGR